MKKMLLIIFFILFSMPVNAEEFMVRALNSWLGYNIEDVISVWGYPTDEKHIVGKNLIYWSNNEYYVLANQGSFYGGESYCNKIFEIDKNGKIISWQYKGNSCPNFYFTGKDLVNPKNDEWKIKKHNKKRR